MAAKNCWAVAPLPAATLSFDFQFSFFIGLNRDAWQYVQKAMTGTLSGMMSSASVAAATWAADVPGAVSANVARPSRNEITAISVTTISTARNDVTGSRHFLTILAAPFAVCC